MSTFGHGSMGSPVQEHRILVANDMQWIDGNLQTRGTPHNFINQDDQEVFTIGEPYVAPWSFTGLPASRPGTLVAVSENIQFLVLPDEETRSSFREAPRTATVIFSLPLAVIRGNVPFLSEAQLPNFLEFYKGRFVPVTGASIHYLAGCAGQLIPPADLLYVNRNLIQSYVQG